ncbi:MAG: NAD-dependent DNA ligase LigA, partial [Eubacterium sp.]|nr:NAD-dependent DNA ligase LigA [Eubacterium sp.]
GELTLRGEAVIKYSDFEEINKSIEDIDAKYKNPRNLCSGSVRQLNSEITAKRNVNFMAFALINAENVDFQNSMENQFKWLENQGFDVVEHKRVTQDNMKETVEYFAEKIKTYDYPSDGLVLMYDDIAYGISLGSTAKFPRNGIAFKWEDEQAETTLKYIEWSPSRTGLINPVAVFEPVELEGTTVTRASVHNVSIVEQLALHSGDRIKVYKANMIIPQISENLTQTGNIEVPDTCPACGHNTEIRNDNGIKTLYCPNKQCPAKNIKAFTLFVSRNAMNIDGLSEETLEKFIDAGYIREFADIYRISRYREEITNTSGFGEKSYDNLITSLNKSRDVELHALIYSLGIPNIGVANAKLICKYFDNDLEKIRHATVEELVKIDGIGDKMAEKFMEYFSDKENVEKLDRLLQEVTIKNPEVNHNAQNMEGLNFVVTGSVNHFANRNEVKEYIEQRGGKVTGSVTSKTNYLINNDIMSNSSKNKKAKELGIEIITEEQFIERWS